VIISGVTRGFELVQENIRLRIIRNILKVRRKELQKLLEKSDKLDRLCL